ncbi:ornithine carbamoyltransferase [Paludifilum halophilum]|uniref:Ornithine carbamoyltransferase n=1 Tax=Paludifilum halophilum TaxID=1642702 RepID=A0A235B6Z1_9BACL|nr:ornithine carbamoyltransferase [Paludifilum halophilum]OYD08078.1 ornithine carbamoyltransferase [Paludifilum halophilum]
MSLSPVTFSDWTGTDCLRLADYSPRKVETLIRKAEEMKLQHQRGTRDFPLIGKTLAMIFEKPSTRTRVSFEAGMTQLGGSALPLNRQELQWGRGETAGDTARVLSGYVDGILIRTHRHTTVEQLAKHASIPVINGLTDLHHPCQALADLLTLKEVKGELTGLHVAYIGDGNNVLHSLMEAAAVTGIHLRAAFPPGYEPDPAVTEQAKELCTATGGSITFTGDPAEAAEKADAVYTDVWASMGQEEEKEKRVKNFAGFQVDKALMDRAKTDAVFLHCLPAYRGLEVSAEVIDGPQSVVFQQAENRLHAQKALLDLLLG